MPQLPDNPVQARRRASRHGAREVRRLRIHGQCLQETRHRIVASDGRRQFDDFVLAEMPAQGFKNGAALTK